MLHPDAALRASSMRHRYFHKHRADSKPALVVTLQMYVHGRDGQKKIQPTSMLLRFYPTLLDSQNLYLQVASGNILDIYTCSEAHKVIEIQLYCTCNRDNGIQIWLHE